MRNSLKWVDGLVQCLFKCPVRWGWMMHRCTDRSGASFEDSRNKINTAFDCESPVNQTENVVLLNELHNWKEKVMWLKIYLKYTCEILNESGPQQEITGSNDVWFLDLEMAWKWIKSVSILEMSSVVNIYLSTNPIPKKLGHCTNCE